MTTKKLKFSKYFKHDIMKKIMTKNFKNGHPRVIYFLNAKYIVILKS